MHAAACCMFSDHWYERAFFCDQSPTAELESGRCRRWQRYSGQAVDEAERAALNAPAASHPCGTFAKRSDASTGRSRAQTSPERPPLMRTAVALRAKCADDRLHNPNVWPRPGIPSILAIAPLRSLTSHNHADSRQRHRNADERCRARCGARLELLHGRQVPPAAQRASSG